MGNEYVFQMHDSEIPKGCAIYLSIITHPQRWLEP